MTNTARAAKIISDTLGVLGTSAENTAYKLAKAGLLAEERRIIRAADALDALDPEPKGGPWLRVNRDAVDTPEVKPGDRVTFESYQRKVLGTVTRCDENGVTIEEVKHDAPPRPTLVDLTPEERAACKWMQCDVGGGTHERGVIIDPLWTGRTGRVLWPGGDTDSEAADHITPRPDLPRMEWPANRTTPTITRKEDTE